MGESKGSGPWMLILGLLLLGAGFASYFIPLSLQDASVRTLPLAIQTVDVPIEGQGTLSTRLLFNGTLPPETQDARYALRLGVSFSLQPIESPAPNTTLRANASLEGTKVGILEVQAQGFNNTTITRSHTSPTLAVTCPCSRPIVIYEFDLFAPQNASLPYRYKFTFWNATVDVVPVDRDADGILDPAQWVPTLPQYFFGFPLTVIGGFFLAKGLSRTA